MDIELLFWEGCPSHPVARAQLAGLLEELGIDAPIVMVEVETDEDAARLGFVGSPTIHVDGEDPFDTAGQPPALTCRVYRLRDGRYSPTPDPEELREFLAARH